MQDLTLADAILDRLTAHAHRIELKGKSLRHTNGKIIDNLADEPIDLGVGQFEGNIQQLLRPPWRNTTDMPVPVMLYSTCPYAM